jgi:hypothetical protein
MLHRSALLSVAAATGVLAAPAVAAGGGRTVKGDGFTTKLPSGWSSHVKKVAGQKEWLFGSRGATVTTLGIPTKGGIGVTAFVQTEAALNRQLRGRVSPDPVRLLLRVVGVPKGAKHLRAVTPAHATTLAGRKAGAATISYTYYKRTIVQTDVVAWHDRKVYFLESDADRSNAAKGQTALNAITAAWTFS